MLDSGTVGADQRRDGQDALTRAVIQIGSVLRLTTEDRRLMAVIEAQRCVEEMRDSFRGAMQVVDAARRLRDSYQASLSAPDASSASRLLEDVERAEVALLVAVGRMGDDAPPAPRSQPQGWIEGAL